jgi:hypothetical protein
MYLNKYLKYKNKYLKNKVLKGGGDAAAAVPIIISDQIYVFYEEKKYEQEYTTYNVDTSEFLLKLNEIFIKQMIYKCIENDKIKKDEKKEEKKEEYIMNGSMRVLINSPPEYIPKRKKDINNDMQLYYNQITKHYNLQNNYQFDSLHKRYTEFLHKICNGEEPKELYGKNILYESKYDVDYKGFVIRNLPKEERIKRLMQRYLRETMEIIKTEETGKTEETEETKETDYFEYALVYTDDSNMTKSDEQAKFDKFQNICSLFNNDGYKKSIKITELLINEKMYTFSDYICIYIYDNYIEIKFLNKQTMVDFLNIIADINKIADKNIIADEDIDNDANKNILKIDDINLLKKLYFKMENEQN